VTLKTNIIILNSDDCWERLKFCLTDILGSFWAYDIPRFDL